MPSSQQAGVRRGLACLAIVAAATAACTNSSTTANHSPSPVVSAISPQTSASASTTPTGPSPSPTGTPVPSPTAVTGAFGVLVSPLTSATYTVSLIGIDGKVVASAQASSPASVSCANTAAAVVPLPVSTTNTRVYFMDAQGVVRFLSPNGDTGTATTVPIGSSRRSMFAVSPDDRRIAVVVDDFSSTGAATRLYVEDLNRGGNHVDPFSETGGFSLWPIGWHGTNNLVVAKVESCTQGGGFGCCGPQELHVVDPATSTRRFTIGGTACVISGPPAAGGVSCETSTGVDNVYDWTGGLLRTYAIPAVGTGYIYISPNGQHLALSTNPNSTTVEGYTGILNMAACGWIDDTHLLAGGDTQQQPRVGDVTTGTITPVAAQGDCGGRIPGGL